METDQNQITYNINYVPPVPAIFKFIQAASGLDDRNMYGTFNMGAGFAIILDPSEVDFVFEFSNYGDYDFRIFPWGLVQAGPRRVVINPLNITFDELGVN